MAGSPLYKMLKLEARLGLQSLLGNWSESRVHTVFHVAEYRFPRADSVWIVDVQRSKYWTSAGGEITANLAIRINAIEQILQCKETGRTASVRLPFLAFGLDKWWSVSDTTTVRSAIHQLSMMFESYGRDWFASYGSPQTIANWFIRTNNYWLASVAHAAAGHLDNAREAYRRNLTEMRDDMDPGGVRWRMQRAAEAGIVNESFLLEASVALEGGIPGLKDRLPELFSQLNSKL